MFTDAPPKVYYGWNGAAMLAGGGAFSAGLLLQHLDLESVKGVSSEALDAVACNPQLSTFAAGGLGGVISRTLTAPLDRLKILAQEGRIKQYTMPHPSIQSKPRPTGDAELMVSTAKFLLSSEGLRGFWRGNGVNCVKAGPEYAAAFTARQYYVQKLCTEPCAPTFLENTVVGAAGGATAQIILYPLELTKQRMAAAKDGEYKGIFDCFAQSVRSRGVRDLYAGCGANLAGIIPHRGLEMGMFFSMQQAVSRQFGDATLVPWYFTTLIGFVASLLAQVATYPLNLARTKLQTQGVNGRAIKYSGLRDCIYKVVKTEGVRGLFAGILPNILKAVPASIIMYSVFNETSKCMQRRKEELLNQQSSKRIGEQH